MAAVMNEYKFNDEHISLMVTNIKGETYEIIFDHDDYRFISQKKWRVIRSQKDGLYYVATHEIKLKYGKKTTCSELMHRLITNCPRNLVVDHINHNGLDNRKRNLRCVSHSLNQQNRSGVQKNSTTGIRGVRFDKRVNRWVAYIRVDSKYKQVGSFVDSHSAEKAVIEARNKYYDGIIGERDCSNQCEGGDR